MIFFLILRGGSRVQPIVEYLSCTLGHLWAVEHLCTRGRKSKKCLLLTGIKNKLTLYVEVKCIPKDLFPFKINL